MLLTRAPLYSVPEGTFLVRLACVKHAASVRSEPESNSPVKSGKSNTDNWHSTIFYFLLLQTNFKETSKPIQIQT